MRTKFWPGGGDSIRRPKRHQSRHAPIPCISPIAKKTPYFLILPLIFTIPKKLLLSFEFYSLFSRARGRLPFWKNPSEGSVRMILKQIASTQTVFILVCTGNLRVIC